MKALFFMALRPDWVSLRGTPVRRRTKPLKVSLKIRLEVGTSTRESLWRLDAITMSPCFNASRYFDMVPKSISMSPSVKTTTSPSSLHEACSNRVSLSHVLCVTQHSYMPISFCISHCIIKSSISTAIIHNYDFIGQMFPLNNRIYRTKSVLD